MPFWWRRARRILPAYFVVMVPYTLFLILRGQAPLSALVWNSTLLAYWVHTPGAFNWYVSGILLFYVLTPGVSAGCAAPGTGAVDGRGRRPRRWLCATC